MVVVVVPVTGDIVAAVVVVIIVVFVIVVVAVVMDNLELECGPAQPYLSTNSSPFFNSSCLRPKSQVT